MKHRFTLAMVLVFITMFSWGQKKEMMQNNFQGADKQKIPAELHFLQSTNPEKQGDCLHSFLSFISKTRTPSGIKSNYDLLQKLDSLVEKTSNNEPAYKEVYTYNSKRNMTQAITFERKGNTNDWMASFKYNITYNPIGNYTQSISYEWDSDSASWIAYDKLDFTYDSGGNLMQEIIYQWDSSTSDWIAYYKYDCAYDISWNMTNSLFSGWDSNTNNWIVINKIEFSYDDAGNMLQGILSDWDNITNLWVANFKIEYSYDATGNMIQYLESDWDSTTNIWVAYYRADCGYDSNRNPISEITYFWDQQTNLFIPSLKFEYTYDLSYKLPNLILPPLDWLMSGYNAQISNMPLAYSYSDWDAQSNSWVKENTGNYYFSDANTNSVTETIDLGIKIYPNPVSEYVLIAGINGNATFKLYNLQGVLVSSKTLNTDERIDVSWLNNGVYFYTLTAEQKKQTGKIIKK